MNRTVDEVSLEPQVSSQAPGQPATEPEPAPDPDPGPPPIVAAYTDPVGDKYSLLEKVLGESRFFETLEQKRRDSGKEKADYFVVIKPNISMMLRRSDVGTYTDPFLVIHLLRLLVQRGYTNLCVVESQNLYGNWFENRNVVQVSARAGYLDEALVKKGGRLETALIKVRGNGVDAQVPLTDLTAEPVPHDFDGEEGTVGKSWAEADFRISFAKMKTHFYSYYTLAIKNVYGCLPEQDKVRAYHCRRKVASWTARVINSLGVDFSIVDGFTAADGILGVKMKAVCRKPLTIFAGSDILSVDHYGARLMGVLPEKSCMFRDLSALAPVRPYQVRGNAAPIKKWRNSSYLMTLACRIIESSAWFMDYSGSLATGGYDDCFPHKPFNQSLAKKLLYYATVPVNVIMDAGWAGLGIKKWLFYRKIKQNAQVAPLITGSPFLMENLAYLSSQDITELLRIIDKGVHGPVTFSGHFLFIGSWEIPFGARLTTATIAVAEIFNHLDKNGQSPRTLARELKALRQASPAIFGKENRCSYCFSSGL